MQSSPNSLQTFFEETVKKFINIYQKGRHRTDETILKIEQRQCVIGKNTEVGCHFLLQGIFPAQGLNLGLPHRRQILYHLSHQGSLS